jgi:hypothetical protein
MKFLLLILLSPALGIAQNRNTTAKTAYSPKSAKVEIESIYMDSLLLNRLDAFQIVQDSISKHTIDIQGKVDSLSSDHISKYMPIIVVIIGALATLWVSYLQKNREYRLVKGKELQATLNKLYADQILLKFYLQELAYLEVDSKFQLICSEIELGESQKIALTEHYNDYKYISENKIKIASTLADINSGFQFYTKNRRTAMNTTGHEQLITMTEKLLNLPNLEPYTDMENANNSQKNDIVKLKEKYVNEMSPLKGLISKLELHVIN